MSAPQANCPSCGGSISFRPGTSVVICEYCTSIVARTDRDLSLVGKASPIVDTLSPLALGAEGFHQDSHFAIVGRTQLRHPAGGIWDEWYLAFDDGRWGWLAEAQGKFFLTFEKTLPSRLPGFDRCQPGTDVDLGLPGRWVVQEIGIATVISAEGELPYYFDPKDTYRYADLVGSGDAYATLDYSDDRPALYLGREVRLSDLRVDVREGYSLQPTIQAVSVDCPHCASPLELQAPNQSQRVTCPSCSSLLDASEGDLRYLSSVPEIKKKIVIPPGSDGILNGIRYMCIGYMERYVVIDHIQYHWDEYLLYNPNEGYRWLTDSNGHWTFVEPISLVDVAYHRSDAKFDGRTFRRFQEAVATVAAIQGEFYWQVELGQRAMTADFISPPDMLSYEAQDSGEPGNDGQGAYASEVQWSKGAYLSGKEVWKAFKLRGRPASPSGIAPNQPSPFKNAVDDIMPWAWKFGGALLAVFLVVLLSSSTSRVYEGAFALPFKPDDSGKRIAFSEPFKIKNGREILQVELGSNVNNSWVSVAGVLINEASGDVQQFVIENSYWHGVDAGYGWSEGSRQNTVKLSAMPAGDYVLRLEAQWKQNTVPPRIEISIRAGGFRAIYFILALFAIGSGPVVAGVLYGVFENRRWQESMFRGGA